MAERNGDEQLHNKQIGTARTYTRRGQEFSDQKKKQHAGKYWKNGEDEEEGQHATKSKIK